MKILFNKNVLSIYFFFTRPNNHAEIDFTSFTNMCKIYGGYNSLCYKSWLCLLIIIIVKSTSINKIFGELTLASEVRVRIMFCAIPSVLTFSIFTKNFQ